MNKKNTKNANYTMNKKNTKERHTKKGMGHGGAEG
jgi:hypothetical protein